MSAYLIVFGAAVRADGQPSGSLMRRLEGALAAARLLDAPYFVPTGGLGETGFVEAEVMARVLRGAGVPENRILIEDRSVDTLESVRRCDAILKARDDVATVYVCTSPYHQPRCWLLLTLLGYRTVRPPMPADRASLGLAKWLIFVAKEFVAAPYDCILLLCDRMAVGRGAPSA